MNVTSAQYNVDMDGNQNAVKATIDGQFLIVPLDPDNRHYAAILEWVAEGNEIQAAE